MKAECREPQRIIQQPWGPSAPQGQRAGSERSQEPQRERTVCLEGSNPPDGEEACYTVPHAASLAHTADSRPGGRRKRKLPSQIREEGKGLCEEAARGKAWCARAQGYRRAGGLARENTGSGQGPLWSPCTSGVQGTEGGLSRG